LDDEHAAAFDVSFFEAMAVEAAGFDRTLIRPFAARFTVRDDLCAFAGLGLRLVVAI
jgi:hypothetical protein